MYQLCPRAGLYTPHHLPCHFPLNGQAGNDSYNGNPLRKRFIGPLLLSLFLSLKKNQREMVVSN